MYSCITLLATWQQLVQKKPQSEPGLKTGRSLKTRSDWYNLKTAKFTVHGFKISEKYKNQ
jgi:hypothetical protein